MPQQLALATPAECALSRGQINSISAVNKVHNKHVSMTTFFDINCHVPKINQPIATACGWHEM
jgi:hypothetical protein